MDEEQRKRCFQEFLSTIPRICSPTMCGLQSRTPTSSRRKSKQESESEEEEVAFNWSVEQLSALNPCEFSNSREILMDYDELTNSVIERENEEFFSQALIAPSPLHEPLPDDDEGYCVSNMSVSAVDLICISASRRDLSAIPRTPKLSGKPKERETETPLNTRLIVKKKLFHERVTDRASSSQGSDSLRYPMMEISSGTPGKLTLRRISTRPDIPFLSPIVPQSHSSMEEEHQMDAVSRDPTTDFAVKQGECSKVSCYELHSDSGCPETCTTSNLFEAVTSTPCL